MSVLITHPPNSDSFTTSYNYYRQSTVGGLFSLIGSKPQNITVAEIQFVDVTGDEAKLYRVTAVDLSSLETQPSETVRATVLKTTRVFDVILDASNKGIPNRLVQARISTTAFFEGIILPELVTVRTNVFGFWFMDLFPNINLDPTSTFYTISIPGMEPARRVIVPVAQTISFRSLPLAP